MVFLIRTIKEKKMKKNFLMVASLLIAAMLMVVSCTQEVAPKNELVEVKLSTVFGRDIEIKDGTDTTSLSYKYTMTPKWNNWTSGDVGIGGANGEKISGIVSTETPVNQDASLGWVTPGLWTVSVYAYDGTNTKVFEGSTEAYFSNQKARVTVYLKPVNQSNNSLTFEIKMQDLDTNGGSYTLKYEVVGTPSITGTTQTDTKISGVLEKTGTLNNVSTYELEKNADAENARKLISLQSDYYRVTVSIYDGDTLLGGITKGVLLSNGDVGKVTGNIEPSDYINAQFDVKLFDVKTSLANSGITYYSDNNYTTAITEPSEATETTEATEILAKSAKATITLTDSTDVDKFDDQIVEGDYSKVNKWYVDGKEQTVTGDSFELKDTTPGYKNVSCQTIYYKVINNTVYYWANTASIQVRFDGNRFAKDSI